MSGADERISTATADLIRAARAFLLEFPSFAPEDYLYAVAEGIQPAVTVAWREMPEVTVTFLVNGRLQACVVPLAPNGGIN